MSAPVYRVHPAIGVARVGDSREHYLAPEAAGALPINPDGRPFTAADFRDREGRVRCQGARFEVYRYDPENLRDPGTPVRPGRDGVARVRWTVHLANKKAAWYEFIPGADGYAPDHPLRNAAVSDPAARRRRLIIDPGPRTVERPGQAAELSRAHNPDGYPMRWPPRRLQPAAIDSLGGLRCDEQSRLVVLGGYGRSGSDRKPPTVSDYANNDGWWDDTADGPVSAQVVMEDGSVAAVEGGWAVVAPLRYAPQLLNVVTLYDTMWDVAVRALGARPDVYAHGLWNRSHRVSWEGEVRPILERIQRYRWVTAIPRHAHTLDLAKLGDPDPCYRPLRELYLSLIRPPDRPNLRTSPDTGLPLMPLLCGDNCVEPGPPRAEYLTLTPTQYFQLQQWAAGLFDVGSATPPRGGAALDRAALENCVGGAFSPGIEVTWVSRDPRIYTAPLRLRARAQVRPPLSLGADFARGLEPGDLCRYMALPWQADFNECSQEKIGERYAYWWPVQRPDFVYRERGRRLEQVPWVGSDRDQSAPDYIQFAESTEMVHAWSQLGFVYDVGTRRRPRLVEVERRLERPE